MSDLKVIRRGGWPERPPMSISSAAEIALDGRDYGSGQVESAARTADNVAAFVGRLVETLSDKGVLSKEETLALLGYGWELSE